jgi:hypothetical protein
MGNLGMMGRIMQGMMEHIKLGILVQVGKLVMGHRLVMGHILLVMVHIRVVNRLGITMGVQLLKQQAVEQQLGGRRLIITKKKLINNYLLVSEQLISQLGSIQLSLRNVQLVRTQCICPNRPMGHTQSNTQQCSNQYNGVHVGHIKQPLTLHTQRRSVSREHIQF